MRGEMKQGGVCMRKWERWRKEGGKMRGEMVAEEVASRTEKEIKGEEEKGVRDRDMKGKRIREQNRRMGGKRRKEGKKDIKERKENEKKGKLKKLRGQEQQKGKRKEGKEGGLGWHDDPFSHSHHTVTPRAHTKTR